VADTDKQDVHDGRSHEASGTIADVPGIAVGNAQDLVGLTGITVVLCPEGARAGVSVMGGAPGTRETDLLRPTFTVDTIHAVFLAGGSAFGLNAAEGIVRYLEERGVGFDTGVARVPIVSGAILFDLGVGSPTARPTADMAYRACQDAGSKPPRSGSYGAGTGATVGKLMGPGYAMRSGLGNSCVTTPRGFKVGAIIAVNAAGDVYHPTTGRIIAGAYDREKKRFVAEGAQGLPPVAQEQLYPPMITSTTIGGIATDALLTKEECNRVAIMAMGGMAQVIRPSFTPYDGDTLFVMSTGQSAVCSKDSSEHARPFRAQDRGELVTEIGIAAQQATAAAIIDAVTPSTYPDMDNRR
jgi:L-aminopeptidase/D-esterase-like protein